MIDSGKINVAQVQEEMEMKKREELLSKHTKPIWQGTGKDRRWKTHLPDEKNTLIAKSTKEALENTLIDYYKKAEDATKTFDDMYHQWRRVKDIQVSDNTIAKYNTDYKRYFEKSDFAKKEIAQITEEDITVFICSVVKKQKLCKKACKTLFQYINNVIYSARVNHLIADNPTQFLAAKQFYPYCSDKVKTAAERLVSDAEMAKLYEQFNEDYKTQPEYIPTYAVHLATLTGMRVGELSALTWDCITDEDILITKSEKYNRITKEYFIGKTKNGKDRSFPLTPQIKDLLDRVKKVEMQNGFTCEWVFADKNGRIHAPMISSCSKNKCRQLGITEKGIHAYRRTVNSKMRCNGVSSVVTSSLLGNSVQVNEQYYTFDTTSSDEKRNIVSKINAEMPIAQ